jgi:hypothetical protein
MQCPAKQLDAGASWSPSTNPPKMADIQSIAQQFVVRRCAQGAASRGVTAARQTFYYNQFDTDRTALQGLYVGC